jgi:hypothetical protein
LYVCIIGYKECKAREEGSCSDAQFHLAIFPKPICDIFPTGTAFDG